MTGESTQEACWVCGGREFTFAPVLDHDLIVQWQLSSEEVEYINQQQGERCSSCGSNLRSIALAKALLGTFNGVGPLLPLVVFDQTKILEINEAGDLHRHLYQLPKLTFATYPAIDMQKLPFEDGAFDIVIHSDTLEHVEHPLRGLRECRRVLSTYGALCFTVPVVIGRMSRSRCGLSASNHIGNESFLVHTEFGADVWAYLFETGFKRVQLCEFRYPAGLAITAWK